MGKQNYDQKFKPWRKGQSAKAKLSNTNAKVGNTNTNNTTGGGGGGGVKRSLKNQLRSKERFLLKLNKNEIKDEKVTQFIIDVKNDIISLKQQIQNKELIVREKHNAIK